MSSDIRVLVRAFSVDVQRPKRNTKNGDNGVFSLNRVSSSHTACPYMPAEAAPAGVRCPRSVRCLTPVNERGMSPESKPFKARRMSATPFKPYQLVFLGSGIRHQQDRQKAPRDPSPYAGGCWA